MMRWQALMVIMDENKEKYMPVEMNVMDGILPKNNKHDIMRMVDICNINYKEDGIVFVDMFGIIYEDRVETWEVSDELQRKLDR